MELHIVNTIDERHIWRLCRLLWRNHARQRFTLLSVALRPKLFRVWRIRHEWSLTIFGIRLHWYRFRQ
jgi:hypothetical protein